MDGEAGDGYVSVAFDPNMFFGRILQMNSGNFHLGGIAQTHFLWPRKRAVDIKGVPPSLALTANRSRPADLQVGAIVRADEHLLPGQAPYNTCSAAAGASVRLKVAPLLVLSRCCAK